MQNKSDLLNPFCGQCGDYKGLGPCKRCDASKSIDTSKQVRICSRCKEAAVVSCFRCGSNFCSTHAVNSRSSKLTEVKQIIGTCKMCSNQICEDCWILDESGRIICMVHLEEKTENQA